jgi:hypothetical protein
MQDLLAGQVNMIFDNIPGALAQYRVNKVRGLGVTSKERTPVVPEIPAIAETLPDFDINSWTTLTGPAKLPPDIVARLSELSKKALESDDLKAKFFDLAATAIWRSPADTVAYRNSEEARLAPISACPASRTIRSSMPCTTTPTPSARSTRGMSRPVPTWRWAMPWRQASPRPTSSCRGRGSSTPRRRCRRPMP